MRPFTRVVALLVGSVLAVPLVVAATVSPAAASHYRATQISWTRTAPTTAAFALTASYRCSFFFNDPCDAVPGNTFSADSLD